MGKINDETKQRILDGNDIVEVIESYFPLKRAGTNYLAVCPFHSEKTPSFNINPARQFYHCFGCGASGDVIRFVMEYENLPFPDATKKLAERIGIQIQEEEFSAEDMRKRKFRNTLQTLQKDAADYFHWMLLKRPEAQAARDYLKGRGIGIDVAKHWNLGYAPENAGPFLDWARQKNYRNEALVEGGLCSWREDGQPSRGIYARFRHRLMFPVADEFGGVIAFSGRVLSKDQFGGKYVNSPETPLFNKSKTFYGFDKAKRAIIKSNRAIIVEGQLDVIAAVEAGVENVIATLGTALTEPHARNLKRQVQDGDVILCYDSDNAGQAAATKAFKQLAKAGVMVRVGGLPAGEDPDSLIKSQGVEAFQAIVEGAPEFFDYQIDRRTSGLQSNTLRERLEFAREISENIALVDDKMLQDSLINRIAIRLGVGDAEVRKLVADAKRVAERAEKTQARREAVQSRRKKDPGGGFQRQENTVGSAGGGGDIAGGFDEPPLEIRNRAIRLLCQLLLSDVEARAMVTAKPPPNYLNHVSDTQIIGKVWTATIDVGVPASVSTFLGNLRPGEQHTLRQLLADPIPGENAVAMAKDCLIDLYRQSVKNRISSVKAAMKQPGIAREDLDKLTEQLLDLTKRLNDIPTAETGH